MAQSKIITETVKPLYAVAGATEVAYEFARGYTLEAQKTAAERFNDVQTRVSKIEREPKALQSQAVSAVNARVAELQKDAKDAQAKFEARVAELQKEARALPKKVQNEIDDTVTEFVKTYTELVDRGEKIIAAIRKDGVKAVTTVRKAPNKSSLVRRERAKVAADKPKNSSRPVKKSATKQPVAKKTPAKTTAKKASATKTAATKGAQSTAKSAQTTAKKAGTTASNTASAATS
jgi:hypothetical protein